jgi:hypothetical protein
MNQDRKNYSIIVLKLIVFGIDLEEIPTCFKYHSHTKQHNENLRKRRMEYKKQARCSGFDSKYSYDCCSIFTQLVCFPKKD